MTLENCKKYAEEATDEKTKKFWEVRIKRKYPEAVTPEIITVEPVEEVEPVKETKKRSKK